MTEEKKEIGKDVETTKKKLQMNNSFGGMKMWFAIMAVYLAIFGILAYVAFGQMDFNDPDVTVGKYLTILKNYQKEAGTTGTEEGKFFKLAMEELMKKAEDAANDTQKLASQSFNIVLGAFLAFLSATVTMLFQGGGTKEEEPEPEETG